MRRKAILASIFLLISTFSLGAATYQTLYSFTSWDDASNPFPGVIFDQNGNLYGVAAWGEINEGVIFELSPWQGRWNFSALHEFDEQDPDGAGPIGGLVMDEAGNLYGTASYDHGEWECGTVFALSPSADFTVLHYFNCTDGNDSEATLTYRNGSLWGTTKSGGSSNQGTVFSIDTSGGSFQYHSFTKKKGTQPLSAFSFWGYGTTFAGGGKGQGNIYRMDPVKGFINVHNFNAEGKSGYAPMGDLLTLNVGGVRTIYGTTSSGGAGGAGTVYRLKETQPNSDKWQFSVLYSFTGGDDGGNPMAGLTADAAGNLYGTTTGGGAGGWYCGTVFKLSPGTKNKWAYSVLHTFDADNSEACDSTGTLVFDKAGNLYGTSQWGGDYFYGNVFEITP